MSGPPVPGKSSTGIDQNLAGALTYLLGIVTGVVFLIIEQENRYVRFHAFQSTFTFVAVAVTYLLILGLPILNWLLVVPFFLAVTALWAFLMFKAVQGERYKLPLIGDWADAQLK
jgi:uncharacterized membrane protein